VKLSWNSLKISIAGAKLTHLVHKDKIWDHGTMVEQVKNIFYKLEKAKNKNDAELVKKYLTAPGFEKFKNEMEKRKLTGDPYMLAIAEMTRVDIIEVHERKKNKPDIFLALINEKRTQPIAFRQVDNKDSGSNATSLKKLRPSNFKEEWRLVRHGDWWLLDEVKHLR
jgi:predicted lipid-binding transport protein (Tim44 family)